MDLSLTVTYGLKIAVFQPAKFCYWLPTGSSLGNLTFERSPLSVDGTGNGVLGSGFDGLRSVKTIEH